MTESAQDQASGAIAASAPVSTRPETNKPQPKAKATKWSEAPEVVGEDSKDDKGDKDDKGEPKSTATHGTEDQPQLAQGVTETAGTVDGGASQDPALQMPARAENDAMQGDTAEKPDGPTPDAGPQPGLTVDPGQTLDTSVMYRDDSDHPHFAGPKAQAAQAAPDPRAVDLDQREKDLDAREAEVERREKAAQPQSGSVTPASVDDQIVGEAYVDGGAAFGGDPNLSDALKKALGAVTLCALALRNGGVVIGSSEADTPESFDPSQGRADARTDARQQLDAMHRYAHRMKVAGL